MSADELDAELLAMAGSDSSDDEGEVDVSQQLDDRSPTPDAVKPSVEKTEDAGGSRRGVAQRVRAKRGARKPRRRGDSEEDDGELSGGSSPRSLGSDAMDHSESEADIPASSAVDDDAPLFPIDNKYTSTEDKRYILSLPEIEREEILAERAQQVIRRQQDLQLKRALASTRAKASSHKRKAAELDEDDGGRRKSVRPKVEKTGRSALDDYKKAREQRGAERNRLDSRRDDRRDERDPSPQSDLDAEGESEEVEWAEPTRASEARREEPPADLKDFERCRVGRSNFAKVCFYPSFETAVKGCFCRVRMAPNRETGQNTYRMVQIKGFVEGKPYKLEAANGKHFTTDQYALVADGAAEKPWPFLACSDSRFTQEEYDAYVSTIKKGTVRVPGRKYLVAKVDDIHKLLNHNWTDEEIQGKINRQRAMERKYDPANAANLARERIKKRQTTAQEEGDEEEVARCEAELAALDVNSANGHSSGPKTGSPAKLHRERSKLEQDRLATLNKMNRRTNAEEVRKALIEEQRKRNQARERARAEYEAKKKAEEEAARNASAGLQVPKNDMADLFGDSDLSRAGTPGRRSRTGTPAATNGVKKEKGPLGAVRAKGKLEEDAIADMDLGIDIEI